MGRKGLRDAVGREGRHIFAMWRTVESSVEREKAERHSTQQAVEEKWKKTWQLYGGGEGMVRVFIEGKDVSEGTMNKGMRESLGM